METNTQNVFYCDQHSEGIAVVSGEEKEKCGVCGEEVKQIGYFEYAEEL